MAEFFGNCPYFCLPSCAAWTPQFLLSLSAEPAILLPSLRSGQVYTFLLFLPSFFAFFRAVTPPIGTPVHTCSTFLVFVQPKYGACRHCTCFYSVMYIVSGRIKAIIIIIISSSCQALSFPSEGVPVSILRSIRLPRSFWGNRCAWVYPLSVAVLGTCSPTVT